MQVWNYDHTNGALVGTSNADPDPLGGPDSWLIPAFATTLAPPQPASGQAPVFQDGAWSVLPDHRGETWWAGYAQPVVITEPGDPAALGLTPTEPPPPQAPLPEPAPADEVLFDHENRIRSLEGQPPLTFDDFLTKMNGG